MSSWRRADASAFSAAAISALAAARRRALALPLLREPRPLGRRVASGRCRWLSRRSCRRAAGARAGGFDGGGAPLRDGARADAGGANAANASKPRPASGMSRNVPSTHGSRRSGCRVSRSRRSRTSCVRASVPPATRATATCTRRSIASRRRAVAARDLVTVARRRLHADERIGRCVGLVDGLRVGAGGEHAPQRDGGLRERLDVRGCTTVARRAQLLRPCVPARDELLRRAGEQRASLRGELGGRGRSVAHRAPAGQSSCSASSRNSSGTRVCSDITTDA